MTAQNKTMSKEITEKDVITFLKKNKDFFKDHEDVLEIMNLPGKEHTGGVVDFQTVLVERLKADKSDAQRLQRELIDTVRANMSNYNRIQTAILVLLEADSFEEFISVLTQDFPALLGVDVVNISIESTSKEIPFVNQSGIRFIKPGTVERILGTGDAALQGDIHGTEEMFGPGAGLVRSQALLRLEISHNTPAGIIAFGSRDANMFQPDQAIDQIGFLAQVVERCFRLWMDLQE